MATLLEVAKEKLRIPELWQLRQWEGEPGKECFVPYRQGERKSGSVFDDGRKFRDFKTGETLDAPGLLGSVENLDNGAACKRFIELAEINPNAVPNISDRKGRRSIARRRSENRSKPTIPALREPTIGELEAIAGSRGLHPGAADLAAKRGLLSVCNYGGHPSWAITDRSGWNAQFRRIDGEPYSHNGEPKKTLGISGGWGSWPIGAANLPELGCVLLVEGSGDLLAAFHFIWSEGREDLATVACMTGAGIWLPPEALELFKARRVRIFPHLDTGGAGEEAGLRWETQLEACGAFPQCFDLSDLRQANGDPVTDLNELALMAPDELRGLGQIATF